VSVTFHNKPRATQKPTASSRARSSPELSVADRRVPATSSNPAFRPVYRVACPRHDLRTTCRVSRAMTVRSIVPPFTSGVQRRHRRLYTILKPRPASGVQTIHRIIHYSQTDPPRAFRRYTVSYTILKRRPASGVQTIHRVAHTLFSTDLELLYGSPRFSCQDRAGPSFGRAWGLAPLATGPPGGRRRSRHPRASLSETALDLGNFRETGGPAVVGQPAGRPAGRQRADARWEGPAPFGGRLSA
jgi:hypothetical protein